MVTSGNFFETLKTADNVGEHWAFTEGCVREGRFDVLEGIGRQMIAECDFAPPDWRERSVFDHLMTWLALEDDERGPSLALSFFSAVPVNVVPKFLDIARAETASKVASAQSPETIEKLLLNLPELETAALLLHESVVRGKLVGFTPASFELSRRLSSVNHPLGWLPLELLHIENRLPVRDHSRTGSGWSIPKIDNLPDPADLEILSPDRTFVEVHNLKRVELIGAADADWRNFSNGRNEVRIFEARPFGQVSLATTLPGLGLECVADEIETIENVPVEAVFQQLFAISSNGGAYNRGCFGAYGRLNAWKSLAGLCGATLEGNAEDILESAMACRWGKFQGGDWFYDIFWDLGVVCLNPERGELVVVAATDVD
jgi:hypothetical protein